MNQIVNDPMMRRIAEANPVPSTTLTAAESQRAMEALERISAMPRRLAGGSSSAQPVRSGKVWRAAAAGAALVAGLAATFLAGSPALAEEVLHEAAQNAAAQTVPAGDFWYWHFEVDEPTTGPYQQEMWVSRTSGAVRKASASPMQAGSDGGSAFDPAGITYLVPDRDTGEILFGDGVRLSWDELDQLPTDSGALKQTLMESLSDSGHGADYDLWHQAVSLLRDSPAGPQLRRALWEVLADIPGIESLGGTTDHAGRQGTAVRADFSDRRLGQETLVLDATEGTLLETVYVSDVGEWRSTVLEQGTRESAP